MKKTVARYIRISSLSQQTGSQEKADKDEVAFIDKGVSGIVPFNERPAGAKLIQAIEDGKIIEVRLFSVDRLGRGAEGILNILNYFKSKDVNVVIDQLHISSKNPDGTLNSYFDLVTGIIGCIAQADRLNILEKQALGIKAAKAKEVLTGKKVYRGRKVGTGLTDAQVLAKYPKITKELRKAEPLSMEKIAKLCDVAPNTVKRVKLTLERLNSKL